MARGWESKSVESQMEEAQTGKPRGEPAPIPEEEATRLREIATLELSRTRIIRELEPILKPRHRDQLRAALDHINSRIAQLKS